MKIRRSAAVAGLAGIGLAVGLVFVGAPSAFAATPTYEPDPNSFGTLSFYDASGNQITSGSTTTAPMAAYAVGSNAGRAGDATTILNMAQPNPNAATGLWNKDTLSGATNYPLPSTGNPANIVTLSNTHPVSKGAATDLSVSDFIGEFPNSDPTGPGCAYSGTASGCTNAAYQNLYQLRLVTANGANQNPQYEVADILVSGTTWTQVFPTVATNTTTTLTSGTNPSITGQNTLLTATESPAAAGSVQFKDGATNLGSPVAVNGSGVATLTQSFSTTGPHPLSAVFTPTDTTSFSGSTGTVTQTVNPPSTPTTTSLAVAQDGTAGHDVTLTATVSPSTAPGSVAFFDNGSATAIPGTVTNPTAGQYVLDLPSGLAAGQHSVVAKFTPTDPASFQASQSGASPFFLSAPATGACDNTGGQRISTDPRTNLCLDPQGIRVTIPVGTLVITTPYTAGAPLDLGTMSLINNSAEWQATGNFQNIQVNDTRSGNLPYTINAICGTLTTTSAALPGTVNTINPENVGLTALAETDSNGYAGTSTIHNQAAAEPAVQPADAGSLGLGGTTTHDIFDTTHGVGTVTLNGLLTIKAPLNTSPGVYVGTITFTVG